MHRSSGSLRTYHVYILSNRYRTVYYVGVTGSLFRRLAQHGSGQGRGFSAPVPPEKDLVDAESYDRPRDAILREKQLKRWRREKKLALIRSVNPSLETLTP